MISIRTSDGVLTKLPKHIAIKSDFLRNLLRETELTGVVDLLVRKDVLDIVAKFMEKDHHVLEEDYNPFEIYFSDEMLSFFDEISDALLVDICNAANYLEYPFLLEITCKCIATRLSEKKSEELVAIIKGQELLTSAEAEVKREEFCWFDDPI